MIYLDNILGNCPKCGGNVVMGEYGPFCTPKCGMMLGYAMGKKLTENQIKKLLDGDSIYLTGLKSKTGKTYDAYVIPDGIKTHSYITKTGERRNGYIFKFQLQFPNKHSYG